MLSRSLLLSLVLVSSGVLVDAALPRPIEEYDVLPYIDPLIGSANGGIKLMHAIDSDGVFMLTVLT